MPPAASALYAYYSEFTYAAILSLALSFQIDPPAEFALFAQMCVTLDNQVKMHKNCKPVSISASIPASIPASVPAYVPAPADEPWLSSRHWTNGPPLANVSPPANELSPVPVVLTPKPQVFPDVTL